MRIRTAIFGVYVAASAVGFAVLMRFMLAEVRPRYVASLRSTMGDSARLLAMALNRQPLPRTLATARTGLRMRVLAGDGRILLDSAAAEAAPTESYLSPEGRREVARRVGERVLDEERRVLQHLQPRREAVAAVAHVEQGGERLRPEPCGLDGRPAAGERRQPCESIGRRCESARAADQLLVRERHLRPDLVGPDRRDDRSELAEDELGDRRPARWVGDVAVEDLERLGIRHRRSVRRATMNAWPSR